MNKKDLWQSVLAELQLELSKANFNAWFKNAYIGQITKINPGHQLVEIAVPNPYIKNIIEARYPGQIKEILERLTKTKNEVKFVVGTQKIKTKPADVGPLFNTDFEAEKQKAYQNAVKDSHLNPSFTFKNFAVSSTNEMAYAAAQAVAKNPGKTYHLLFFYGGVGVGKTHLTQAIGHEILQNDSRAAVIYCTSEEFTNGIVQAIRNKSTQYFRKKFRSAKALLIDDIQFIGGKETVQEEFFHTFNAIHAEGGQIVLTSDRLPHEIKSLEARLRSRFEGGLTIDVQEPNFELRTAILLIKSRQRGKKLPMDVAQLIAQNIKSTRQLEGFLISLLAQSKQKQKRLTPEFCQKMLKNTGLPETKIEKRVSPKEIIDLVASFYNLTKAQMVGPKRAKPIVVPRQIAMYLIRKKLGTPYIQVGHLFGGRDHTTVMHAEEKIENLLPESETLRLEIQSLQKKLYS